MSDQFVAEVRIVGFNFPPTGWAFCNGQIMPLSQNTALFSLLGTTYGGDGKSNFALPDLQGSVPLHPGQGQGLSQRVLGEQSGAAAITLLQTEIPFHTHQLRAANTTGDTPVPNPSNSLARYPGQYQTNTSANQQMMAPQALPVAGGSLPHNNLMPFLTLNFVIALQGIFPSRP